MSEKRKLPIDRPCSACSAGDTKMEYHDHRPPFREPVASPQATRPAPTKQLSDELWDAYQEFVAKHPDYKDTWAAFYAGAAWLKERLS